jgi:hypothetical protein
MAGALDVRSRFDTFDVVACTALLDILRDPVEIGAERGIFAIPGELADDLSATPS